MNSARIFGLVVVVLVLTGSECSALSQGLGGKGEFTVTTSKISGSTYECKDDAHPAYCEKIKMSNFCTVELYSDVCKKTCGDCERQQEIKPFVSVPAVSECRDVGEKEFCKEMKQNNACVKDRWGLQQGRFSLAQSYCRKTCGLCIKQQTVQEDDTCIDKPICERLTTLYNIKNCYLVKHPQLRKRAFKKCPKLCGVCKSAKRKEPEVPKVKRPVAKPVEAGETVAETIANKKRLPHPPVENIDSDDEPRRGVFYIFTKYLSL